MSNDRNAVVVSNGPHRFHLYQTALAYYQAGLLKRLITGWYLGNSLLIRVLENLNSRKIFGKLPKRLLSRRQQGISPAYVVSLPIPDLIERLDRGKIGKLWPGGMASHLSMMAFGRRSQPFVRDAKLFHVRSGYGRFAMAEAKRHGAVCLVDHSIADPLYMDEIITEEASRWGLPYEFPWAHWKSVSQDINEADHILVNSAFVRETLMACRTITREKISILTLGVDLQRFSPRAGRDEEEGTFRLLFVGELGLRKGALYLLEAFKKLNLSNAELLMVGPIRDIGPLLPRDGRKVRYLASLPQEDLVPYIQNSSVFVFPSLIEGSARVIQEAMACGIPVITTPNSGSVITDGVDGFIVPIRDTDALCERILELYASYEKRAAIGKAARTTAERLFAPGLYRAGLVELFGLLVS